jgi:hypothetical protein
MPRQPIKLPDKICPICGRTFNRNRFGKVLEDTKRYLSRKTCSQSCGNTLLEPQNRTTFHLRARKHLGPRCEMCGSNIALDVHHLDGNIKNNESGNLQTLCHGCHMKWHLKQNNWFKDTQNDGWTALRPSAIASSRKSHTKSLRQSQG